VPWVVMAAGLPWGRVDAGAACDHEQLCMRALTAASGLKGRSSGVHVLSPTPDPANSRVAAYVHNTVVRVCRPACMRWRARS
jgi:hypothetical protein